MLSSTNVWMGLAGLIYLIAGVFMLRKEISAARGWDKLINLGCVFIAVPLARTGSGRILSAARCSQPLPALPSESSCACRPRCSD
jgi:hypothetical protein